MSKTKTGGKPAAAPPAKSGRISRGLRPRTKETYTNEQFGQGDSFTPPGNFMLNEKAGRMKLFKPAKAGLLVFRPWPCLDPENPNDKFMPGRISTHPRGLSNWLVRVPVVQYAGLSEDGSMDGKVSFVLHLPGDKLAQQSNPYRILVRKARAAMEAGEFGPGRAWNPRWNKLLVKNMPAMPYPKDLVFIQGDIFLVGDTDYLDERDEPFGAAEEDEVPIMHLSPLAGEAIYKLCSVQKDAYEGNADLNPSIAFRLGDPVGKLQADGTVKGGAIFSIWSPENYKHKPPEKSFHTWDGTVGKNKKQAMTYQAQATRNYVSGNTTHTADLAVERVNNIFNKVLFWFTDEETGTQGALKIMPVEEQAAHIARAFAAEGALLQRAWAGHGEFFTDEVRGILAQRKQAVSPGAASAQYEDTDDETDGDEDETTPTNKSKDPGLTDFDDVEQPIEDEGDEFADETGEAQDEAEGDADAEDETDAGDDFPADDEGGDTGDDVEGDSEGEVDEFNDDDGAVEDETEVEGDDEGEGEGDDEGEGAEYDEAEAEAEAEAEGNAFEGVAGMEEATDENVDFDPDAEAVAKEKALQAKMADSLKKASGSAEQRAANRASTKTAPPPPPTKPAATKPAATKPAATKPAATKPAATKPATKPAATKPATKPAATKPAATKPAATKPAGKPGKK